MEYNSKQNEILNVTEKLFAEKGYDGTSIRDIAKAADINVAMVSYYFGSKEKLLDALIINRVSCFGMLLETIQIEAISPVEKIKKYVALYIDRLYENKEVYQIINFEVVNQKRTSHYPAFSEIKRKNLKLLESILIEGENLNLFHRNYNVLLIPAIVIGTFSQIQNNKKFYIEMLHLEDDIAFENYILNDFKKEITNTVLAMIIK